MYVCVIRPELVLQITCFALRQARLVYGKAVPERSSKSAKYELEGSHENTFPTIVTSLTNKTQRGCKNNDGDFLRLNTVPIRSNETK